MPHAISIIDGQYALDAQVAAKLLSLEDFSVWREEVYRSLLFECKPTDDVIVELVKRPLGTILCSKLTSLGLNSSA